MRTTVEKVRYTAGESALHSGGSFLLRAHLVGKDLNWNLVSESRDKHAWEAPRCMPYSPFCREPLDIWCPVVSSLVVWWVSRVVGMARPIPGDNQQPLPLLSEVEV